MGILRNEIEIVKINALLQGLACWKNVFHY